MGRRHGSAILLLSGYFLQIGHSFVGAPLIVASRRNLNGRVGSSFEATSWLSNGERPMLITCDRDRQRWATSTGAYPSVSMGLDSPLLCRRELLRVLGAGFAGFAAASAGIISPGAAEAAGTVTLPRRPLAKRKSPFLCDDAISYSRNPTKQSEVWIVGTAHISNSSAQLVENVIREVQPQVVMVELDAQRVMRFLQEIEQEDASAAGVASALPVASTKPSPIFGSFLTHMLDSSESVNDRVTDLFAAAVGRVISKMYESLGQQGYSPGREFSVAIREARRCGAKILLGDRNVKETLRRLSQALQATDLDELALKSQSELGVTLQDFEFSGAASIGENAEKLKNRSMMSKLISIYKEDAPELYAALIGERDKVMAVNLMTLEPKKTTVAVVGLAHVEGIEAILSANGWKVQRC